jgi:Plasmid encoded RepA protein
MSDSLPSSFRPVDRKRLDSLYHRTETPLESADIWFLHSVLCQCFLPYKDPKTDRWQRTNGDFSVSLVAGDIKDPHSSTALRSAGLPYGPKPRLFQSYICMKAIKHQSTVVPVERSMSDMMHVLGLAVTGGKYGGSALHVMLFLVCLMSSLCIFNGLSSDMCPRALLGYHYR